MAEKQPNQGPGGHASTQSAQFREDLVCDRCGRPGAFDFGSRKVCLECYEGGASCCPEFGQDDLWPAED